MPWDICRDGFRQLGSSGECMCVLCGILLGGDHSSIASNQENSLRLKTKEPP